MARKEMQNLHFHRELRIGFDVCCTKLDALLTILAKLIYDIYELGFYRK